MVIDLTGGLAVEFLLRLLGEIDRQRNLWESASEPMPDLLLKAVAEMWDEIISGEFPLSVQLQPVRTELQATRAAWDRLLERYERTGSWSHPEARVVWEVLERAIATADEVRYPKPPPLESVAQLRSQGVNFVQIARMYEWRNARGEPDPAKVMEEVQEPGKHTTGFVPQPLLDWESDKERRRLRSEHFVALRQQRFGGMETSPPEDFEDAVRQGISGRQLCKMFGITQDVLIVRCTAVGLSVPPMDYPNLAGSQGQHDRRQARQDEQEGGPEEDEPLVGDDEVPEEIDDPWEEAKAFFRAGQQDEGIVSMAKAGASRAQMREQSGIDGRAIGGILRKHGATAEK